MDLKKSVQEKHEKTRFFVFFHETTVFGHFRTLCMRTNYLTIWVLYWTNERIPQKWSKSGQKVVILGVFRVFGEQKLDTNRRHKWDRRFSNHEQFLTTFFNFGQKMSLFSRFFAWFWVCALYPHFGDLTVFRGVNFVITFVWKKVILCHTSWITFCRFFALGAKLLTGTCLILIDTCALFGNDFVIWNTIFGTVGYRPTPNIGLPYGYTLSPYHPYWSEGVQNGTLDDTFWHFAYRFSPSPLHA